MCTEDNILVKKVQLGTELPEEHNIIEVNPSDCSY